MPKYTPQILTVTIFAILPLLIWLEQSEPKTFYNRLHIPNIIDEPDRHTPIHTDGNFLPPIINQDLTLSPQDSPIILTTKTTVFPESTLTILPGTTIYAHEFSQLIINGQLIANGSQNQPITIATNELHPQNQNWNGIIINSQKPNQLTHAIIQHANPGVSCLPQSQAKLSNLLIKDSSLGAFISSPICLLTNSRIISLLDGVTTTSIDSPVSNTVIQARRHQIRIY